MKEAKQKYCKRKNILKQNEGKTASIYFRFDAKQKYWSKNEAKRTGSETKRKEKYGSEKQSEKKNTEA